MADWTQLPFDLLGEIVMRLETMEDLVYFSLVNRTWNYFASTIKHKFCVKVTPCPWLLLGENTEDNNPDGLRKVYDIYRNKFYQFKIPETIGCRCWGSAYGWIVTYNKDLELHLFNPLTKARISLPPISSLPYQYGLHHSSPKDVFVILKMRLLFIRKAFVIKVAENDFIVFVSYCLPWSKLAFARPGDKSWISIDDDLEHAGSLKSVGSSNSVHEVICVGNQILILYKDSSLGYLDISDLNDPHDPVVDHSNHCSFYLPDVVRPGVLGIRIRGYIPSPPRIPNEYRELIVGSYLVYTGGVIFMVLRSRGFRSREHENNVDDVGENVDDVGGDAHENEHEDVDEDEDDSEFEDEYTTFGFAVYKLNFDKRRWYRVYRLGNVNFFVGNCSSMSDSVIRGRSDYIFYNDDLDEALFWLSTCEEDMGTWGEDMGACRLTDGSLYDITPDCDKSDICSKV